jgi:opacity protein-like surface antigen
VNAGKPQRKGQQVAVTAASLCLLALLPAARAAAQDTAPVQDTAPAPQPSDLIGPELNFYGLPGLMDMPTATMMPDAEVAVTVSTFAGMTRGTLSFQITPWLMGSFRYSGIQNWNANGFDTYYDRSFDLRMLLLSETKWRPELSIGIQDFIGTGLYSAEYVVATKTMAEGRLSLTGGLGWGRFGSYGAFGSTGTRPPQTAESVGEGGTVNGDTFFRGDVAAFAGLAYRPTDRVTLKAEYSSDAYEVEDDELGIFDRSIPFNFGVEYQVNRDLRLGAYAMYGSQVGATLQFTFNPDRPLVPGGADPAPPPVLVRPDRATAPQFYTTDWVQSEETVTDIRASVRTELNRLGLDLEALELTGGTATLYLRNTGYQATPQAIGRTARLMSRLMPSSVETFTIVQTAEGIILPSYTFSRTDVEELVRTPAGAELMLARGQVEPNPDAPAPGSFPEGVYPRFIWDIGPYLRYSLFDPDNPLRWEVGIAVGAEYNPAPGWVFAGRVGKSIYSTMDDVTRESNSQLPPVRSDFALYDKNGDPGIRNLYGAYYFKAGDQTYGRFTAGYLERMYVGVSGELLWAPHFSRLALGAELNYVQQRDYDGGFGTLDYDVVTGHGTLYWRFDDDFFAQIDVGRYLAGDYGSTIALERVFANGWRLGAFATFTDVSAEEFGEGSFDKGITMTIPLGWLLNRSTRLAENLTIRPLQRDGGARLSVPQRLYGLVEDSSRYRLEEQWGRIWR